MTDHLQLQAQVAGLLTKQYPDYSWAKLRVKWTNIGGSYSHFTLQDASGSTITTARGPIVGATGNALSQLRTAMYTRAGGTWQWTEINVEREGKFSFSFNYDDPFDPTGGLIPPAPAALLEDLERYPRPEAEIPSWYPAGPSQILAAPRYFHQPPAHGAVPNTRSQNTDIGKVISAFGDVIDHFGSIDDRVFTIGGGTIYERSAIPPAMRPESELLTYRLTGRPVAGLIAEVGVTAPAFGGEGGATQVVFLNADGRLYSARELIGLGALEQLETAKPPAFFDQHPHLVQLAQTCLNTTAEDVRAHHADMPDDDAVYVWRPIRGGGKVIICSDGTFLFGASSLTVEQLLAAFRSGKRSQPLV